MQLSDYSSLFQNSLRIKSYSIHIRSSGGIELENLDWDLIISAASLRRWILERSDIRRIKLIRTSDENSDVSVYCELKNGEKVDFLVTRSTDSFLSRTLSSGDEYSNKHTTCSCWVTGEHLKERRKFHKFAQNMKIEIRIASIRTLFLLKFNHQWEKTATDFHEMIEFLKDSEITKNLIGRTKDTHKGNGSWKCTGK